MGDPAKRRATYEDLLAVSDVKIAEIIDGVLHVQPRPASPHARASLERRRARPRSRRLASRAHAGDAPRRRIRARSRLGVRGALSLDGETYRIVATHVASAVARAEPFDAIELDLAILWAR